MTSFGKRVTASGREPTFTRPRVFGARASVFSAARSVHPTNQDERSPEVGVIVGSTALESGSLRCRQGRGLVGLTQAFVEAAHQANGAAVVDLPECRQDRRTPKSLPDEPRDRGPRIQRPIDWTRKDARSRPAENSTFHGHLRSRRSPRKGGSVSVTQGWAMSSSPPDSCGAPASRQPHSSRPGVSVRRKTAGLRGVGSSSLPLDRPLAAVAAEEKAFGITCSQCGEYLPGCRRSPKSCHRRSPRLGCL